MATGKLLRIPVVSGVEGLAAAVRRRLLPPAARSSLSASQILFAQSQLEIVDVPPPPPPPPPSNGPWALSSDQRDAVERATVMLADASTGARLLLPVDEEENELGVKPQELKWMQSTYAGIEPFFKRLALQETDAAPAFAVTRAGGVMPVAMAQYVFGWIIALERKLLQADEYRRRGEYAHEQMQYRSFRPLTVGILGLGDIGQGIGRLLKTGGFRVAGFKRLVDKDAEVEARLRDSADLVTDDLNAVLSQSDVVVSVLPSTPATRYLLTDERLAATCRDKKPVFINVGRGDVISEATVISALDNQLFSTVVLDVFETEPLPQQSKLWTHPNVHLTPHVSALSLPDDIADVFVRNLDRFVAQQPLLFPVDWSRGY